MDIVKLIDENFDNELKAVIYNNFRIALAAYEKFLYENVDFFSFDKKQVLYGHLRTYAIERQFTSSAFTPKSRYSVSMKKVNAFGYKALTIETDDFVVNIGNTFKSNMLLPASNYKKEYAKSNEALEQQMVLDFVDNHPVLRTEKKYAEIAYGYKNMDLSHLDLLIPTGDYKGIIYSSNLLENTCKYDEFVPRELVEESIVSLKNDIKKEVKMM